MTPTSKKYMDGEACIHCEKMIDPSSKHILDRDDWIMCSEECRKESDRISLDEEIRQRKIDAIMDVRGHIHE